MSGVPFAEREVGGVGRKVQEVSVLVPHLLQSALVHVNTLPLERILEEPGSSPRMTEEDSRVLSPLF